MAITYFICIKSVDVSNVGVVKPIHADIDVSGFHTDNLGNTWIQTGYTNTGLPEYPDAKVTNGVVGYDTTVPLSDTGDEVTYALAPLKSYPYDGFVGIGNDKLGVSFSTDIDITSATIIQHDFEINNDKLGVSFSTDINITSATITQQDINMTGDNLDVTMSADINITSATITQYDFEINNDNMEVDIIAEVFISTTST